MGPSLCFLVINISISRREIMAPTARTVALPLLLCAAELVRGSHAFVSTLPGRSGAASCSPLSLSPAPPSVSQARRGVRRPRSGRGCDSRSTVTLSRSGLRMSAAAASSQGTTSGVTLPPLEQTEEYAAFLAESIRVHLDEDWMEQTCHAEIGDAVADIYRSSRTEGVGDLSGLLMAVGNKLCGADFDMGDAFVNGWDVANIMSDFLIIKMGLETCACSTQLPERMQQEHQPQQPPSSQSSSTAGMEELDERLGNSEFARYRFLSGFVDEQEDWRDMNLVLARELGFFGDVVPRSPQKEDEDEDDDEAGGGRRWRGEERRAVPEMSWTEQFAGGPPPQFELDAVALERLEGELPSHPDDLEGLETFVEAVLGESAKKQADEDVEGNGEYLRRSVAVRWLYYKGWVNRDW